MLLRNVARRKLRTFLSIPGVALSIAATVALPDAGLALGVGIVGGLLPARRAAWLDPVQALRAV